MGHNKYVIKYKIIIIIYFKIASFSRLMSAACRLLSSILPCLTFSRHSSTESRTAEKVRIWLIRHDITVTLSPATYQTLPQVSDFNQQSLRLYLDIHELSLEVLI